MPLTDERLSLTYFDEVHPLTSSGASGVQKHLFISMDGVVAPVHPAHATLIHIRAHRMQSYVWNIACPGNLVTWGVSCSG